MDRLEGFLTMLDYALDTKKKRHIVGGILMSVSSMFVGLALTVMTMKQEENNNELQYIE